MEGTSAKKEGQVSKELSILLSALGGLEEALDDLQSNLSPLVYPVSITEKIKPESEAEPSLAPIAESIREARKRVSNATERIRATLREIEI